MPWPMRSCRQVHHTGNGIIDWSIPYCFPLCDCVSAATNYGNYEALGVEELLRGKDIFVVNERQRCCTCWFNKHADDLLPKDSTARMHFYLTDCQRNKSYFLIHSKVLWLTWQAPRLFARLLIPGMRTSFWALLQH